MAKPRSTRRGGEVVTRSVIWLRQTNMFYVYVLKSSVNGDLYIGKSDDLRSRFESHNKGRMKATKPFRPWALVYYEAYKDKRDISRRERQLKEHKAKNDLKTQLKHSLEK